MGSMDRYSSGLRRGTVYHAFCGFSIRTPSLRVSRAGQISGECGDALAGSDMGVCAQGATTHEAASIGYSDRLTFAAITTEISSPLPPSDVASSHSGKWSATTAGPSCWMAV